MSIKTIFSSFFKTVGHFLEEVFGNTNVEAKVNATLNLLTPAAVALANLAGGAEAGPLVTAAVSQFQADYATLCSIVQGSFPAPGTNAAGILKGIITSLQQNVGVFLKDAGIKNSAHFSEIQTYANFFLNETSAILEEFVSLETGAPAPAAPAAPAPISMTAKVEPAPAPEAAAPAPAPVPDEARVTGQTAAPLPAHVPGTTTKMI